jgi:hypothetical protein
MRKKKIFVPSSWDGVRNWHCFVGNFESLFVASGVTMELLRIEMRLCKRGD